jgi:CheY-like chemotaxis protein
MTARRTRRGVNITIRNGAGRAASSATASSVALVPQWGISLAKTLLERSGAELSGYSTVGHGTHLTLRLPATPPSTSATNRQSTAARTAARTAPQRAGAIPDRRTPLPEPDGVVTVRNTTSVLIVDDNTALTSALALRLAMDGGFDCLPAMQELRNAVEHILSLQPTIVLLDLNLPGTERSIDVIRALRTRAPNIRVIVLTGNPSPHLIRAARDAGAVGFVAKGVHPDRLLAVMRRAAADEFVLELDG